MNTNKTALAVRRYLTLSLIVVVHLVASTSAMAQTSAFTYQGKLADNNNQANGQYDFQFKLFDSPTVGTGNQLGSTVTVPNVTVTAGIFTVSIDFGSCATCFNGSQRFLEIAVKQASVSTFNTLGPRQALTSNPYAIRSLNAAAADGLSVACVNCVTSNQIQNVQGSQINGAIPVASVPAGSDKYVQNTTTQQASSNFNISGDGTAGGTISGNAVNAVTQYNLGGQRLLTVTGSASFPNSNVFLGPGAGALNAPNVSNGVRNTFVGMNAGAANTTGIANSFFGALAGESNVNGGQNSFFGRAAGEFNESGLDNSFFGSQAGQLNRTGRRNTYVGSAAGGPDGLTNASAFGYRAQATQSNSLILGGITDTAGFPLQTKVGIGTTAPAEMLHVVGNGILTGNMNINGDAAVMGRVSSNIIDATTQYNMAGARVLSNGGINNLIAGIGAGSANVASQNAFFGFEAGKFNTDGSNNAFFGAFAGKSNVTGLANSFFGSSAGENTTSGFNSFFGSGSGFTNATGTRNSFFGANSGQANTSGFGNSFFGMQAGWNNLTGSANSFFGDQAGRNNNADLNAFFGSDAGFSNTTGASNTFLGSAAAYNNSTGSGNTIIGSRAGVGTNNLSNAAAIGQRALVACNNCLVLGSINGINDATADTKVGIGTTAPDARFQIRATPLNPGSATFFSGTGAMINSATNNGGSSPAPPETVLVLARDGVAGQSFANFARFDLKRYESESTPSRTQLDIRLSHSELFGEGNNTPVIMSLQSNGSVGIGVTSPSFKLHVNGSVAGVGPYQDVSDIRYKRSIQPIANALSKVLRLRGVSYDWRQDEFPQMNFGKGRKIGFIAQELEQILPEAVAIDNEGYYTVAYSSVTPLLVEAIKEQQSTLEQLKQENADLRDRLAALEQLLKKQIHKP